MGDRPTTLRLFGEDVLIDRFDEPLNPVRGRGKVQTSDKEKAAPVAGNSFFSEVLSGIAGGAFLGWLVDHFAQTSPWGLILALLVGLVVAGRNIRRIAKRNP